MKLVKFRINEFRSIEDSGWIKASDLTTLVGSNESGKTNLMIALWKLNENGENPVNPVQDMPRHKYYSLMNAPVKPVFVTACFALNAAERGVLAQKPYGDRVRFVYVGKDYDGVKKNRPLTFLAQIDLSEAHPFDRDGVLPDKGMLYFFYETETMKWGFDPEDKGCARVYYFEKTEGFTALNAPEELSDEFVIPEIRMSFGSGKSIPSYEEMDIHIPSYDMDYDDYEKLLEKNGIENICERHKLLGYADLIQGEALSDCEAVSRGVYMGSPEAYNKLSKAEKEDIKLHAADWVLLFQMASICDREPEVIWGDMGNLYFYIRKDDIKAGRFDRVQLTLQCG